MQIRKTNGSHTYRVYLTKSELLALTRLNESVIDSLKVGADLSRLLRREAEKIVSK